MMNKWASLGLFIAILCLAACNSNGNPTATIPITTAASIPTLARPTDSPTPTKTALPISTSTATPIPQVNLEAVGDIMLGRTIGQTLLAKGPQVVFAGVQSILASADILVGNLECTITNLDQPERKYFTLKAPPDAARALSLAGFDVLGLANNHAMDFGYPGLSDTQNFLSQYGIATVGAGTDFNAAHTPVIIEKNGLRLAFLAYVDVNPENSGFDAHTWVATQSRPGLAWADPDQIKADVSAAKLEADLVIVLLHAGIEITDVINGINDTQRLAAQAAIDAGAALVIGSHPHVLQRIERYHGGLIAYSLGNFVFDQYDGIANAAVILRVVLSRDGVQSYDYVPVLIDKGLPHVISEDQAPAIGTLVAPITP